MRVTLPLLLSLAFVSSMAAQSDSAITLARGASLLQNSRFSEAAEVLAAVTSREPGNGRAWNLLGRAYYRMQKYPEALAANMRAAQVPQVRPTALYNAGLMHALMGHRDSAFAYLFLARETRRIDVTQIAADSDAASLRSDPRYRQLFPTREEYDRPFAEPVTILGEWRGESVGDQFGWIARSIGDVDGDRIADFVTSAPSRRTGGANGGRIYVYSTRTRKLLWHRDGEGGDQLGTTVEAAGDVNRDGIPDVIAAAPGAGAAYIYSGRDGLLLRTLKPDANSDGFGGGVSDIGDVNGDGFDDVVVGTSPRVATASTIGHAYVISGQDGATLLTLAGEQPGDGFGSAVAGATENGRTLIVVGAARAGPRGTGRTYVYHGLSSTPAFTIDSDSTGAALGGMFVSLVGDVNRDRIPDVYSADFPNAAQGPSTGRIYVVSGKDGTPLLTVTGEGPGNGFGVGPADAGDINGDGYDDLAVGAWQFAGAAPSGGKIYIISGRDGAMLGTITGQVPGETLGFDSTGLGDVNGDGVPDLLITSAWSSINGYRSGRVYVVSGK